MASSNIAKASCAAITINGREIGPGHPVYVVAEMSANHNHSFERALETVHAAKEAGCDAIKLQTYTADTLTIDCARSPFSIGGGLPWSGRTLYDLYREASMPWEWQPSLKREANRLGLDLFSTPFDEQAVDWLEKLEVPAYKIASFELVDLELIRRVARTGRPLIISTGIATCEEINEAVTAARDDACEQIALLKCTSAYPAPPEEANLRTIPDMALRFSAPVGLSDHTLGIAVPVAAVALGACIVEKHFTLSRKHGGPDSAFSLEPAEFAEMVRAIRAAEGSLGKAQYGATEHEKAAIVFRRSLFVVADLAAGELLTRSNIRSIRPGYGLAPKHLGSVLGRRAACDISRGTPLSWSLIA